MQFCKTCSTLQESLKTAQVIVIPTVLPSSSIDIAPLLFRQPPFMCRRQPDYHIKRETPRPGVEPWSPASRLEALASHPERTVLASKHQISFNNMIVIMFFFCYGPHCDGRCWWHNCWLGQISLKCPCGKWMSLSDNTNLNVLIHLCIIHLNSLVLVYYMR